MGGQTDKSRRLKVLSAQNPGLAQGSRVALKMLDLVQITCLKGGTNSSCPILHPKQAAQKTKEYLFKNLKNLRENIHL